MRASARAPDTITHTRKLPGDAVVIREHGRDVDEDRDIDLAAACLEVSSGHALARTWEDSVADQHLKPRIRRDAMSDRRA
eukprot:1604631-Rhodomonas_salina.5